MSEKKCFCAERSKLRTQEEKNNLEKRINRIIGQMNGIKNMIEDNRYCSDIIIQLSAIDKAIKSLANLMIDNHIRTCVVEHIKNDDYSDIEDISTFFKRFQ